MSNKIQISAVNRTNNFVARAKSEALNIYEELRIMIDEEGIIEDIGAEDEGDYIEKYLSELSVKAVRNHLNVARFIHKMKNQAIEISLAVSFTTLRALQGSFKEYKNDEDRRLHYQMKAWEIAVYNNDLPRENDVDSAIEEVKLTIEKKDKLEQALEKFVGKLAKVKSNEEKYYNELPSHIRDIFDEELAAKRINYFLDELINVFDSKLTTKNLNYHEKLLTQSYTVMQEIIAALRDYEEDQESLKEVMDDIYLFTNLHSKAISHRKEISTIKKQLNELD